MTSQQPSAADASPLLGGRTNPVIAQSAAAAAPLHPSVTSSWKRLIDVVGALVGLVLTTIIAIPIVIAIQFDNPGSILYSQVRCGHQGKTFRIWKFRSMVRDADRLQHLVNNEAQGLIFKNKNDPRITRVGRFLRRTSLDELPQFWNVLMGDMSLVGTRPPTVSEVMQYRRHHWQRLHVKPGITGEWQVKGRSGVNDFEQIVAMDVSYQQHWSVWYDLSLIMQTILVVLTRKGAY
ncbi:sugar transferase [Halomicronema hongdechloris C2206]|uniref:Sugar transferase n=1 Tax=Halomicronema hongdechloris C2206 TaxID=1641165 RepID=A0A1Z3HL96_9CYAN|nr:sugar transferase [Halomicronema hongdechloris]ASC70867.1 sugar transferase [Halomicronema hongdechloris C2206]